MSDTAPILIIEDEKEIRRFVRIALESENYTVCESNTVKEGLIAVATHKPQLIILDLGLPDQDGNDFIRECRTFSQTPIIVLSARTDEIDKITALDLGADDYLIKPFSSGELLARLRALLRRRSSVVEANNALVAFGDTTVDLARHIVTYKNNIIHLTQIEYHLLTLLLSNAGKVLTHRFLLREVWGPSFIESNHYVRIYVGHLRQKLENNPTQPQHFITETGIGYRFQL